MSVVDFAKAKQERGPHCRGRAFCMTCDHEWEAIWPAGAVDLECPECHACTGRSKYEVIPPPGTQVWQCRSCTNQLFYLLPDRVHCPGCGTQWNYADLIP